MDIRIVHEYSDYVLALVKVDGISKPMHAAYDYLNGKLVLSEWWLFDDLTPFYELKEAVSRYFELRNEQRAS